MRVSDALFEGPKLLSVTVFFFFLKFFRGLSCIFFKQQCFLGALSYFFKTTSFLGALSVLFGENLPGI